MPLFGFPHGVGLEPVSVNVARMLGIFAQGVRDLGEVWGRALEGPTLAEVAALAAQGERDFRFPDPLWVRVVHDFAVAYHRRALPREQLLRSLVPLYLGRTASFVLQNEHGRRRGRGGGDPGPRRRVRAAEAAPARAVGVRT